jgi:hypothetical protein
MKLQIILFVAGTLLSGPRVHASDELVTGLRVRVRTAEVVSVSGLFRADKTHPLGADPRADEEAGIVSVKGPDGGRMTFPRPRRTLVGEIVAIDEETLVLKLDGRDVRVTIPLSSIAKADKSVGKHGRSRGQGALLGLGIGALAGATAGLLSGDDICAPSGEYFSLNCLFTLTADQKAALLGVLGAGAGTVVGAIVGAGRTDRWSSITIRETSKMKLSVRPLGKTGAVLRLGF